MRFVSFPTIPGKSPWSGIAYAEAWLPVLLAVGLTMESSKHVYSKRSCVHEQAAMSLPHRLKSFHLFSVGDRFPQ